MYLILFVLHQILRPKASLPQKRDEQNTLKPKKKEGLDGTGRCKIVVAGKENAIGIIAVSQKCNARDPSAVGMVKDQKRIQHKVPQRLGRQSVLGSKVKSCRLLLVIIHARFIDVKILYPILASFSGISSNRAFICYFQSCPK